MGILKKNWEAFKAFQNLKTIVESESNGASTKCLRTDHGREITSEEFSTWCEEKGLQHTPHICPQQNGVVERKNKTIVGLVRSMLKDKSLLLKFWGEAIDSCV